MVQKPRLSIAPMAGFFRHFFIFLLIVIFLSFGFLVISLLINFSGRFIHGYSTKLEEISLTNFDNLPEIIVGKNTLVTNSHNYRCSYYDCFNVYRCGHKGLDRLTVYVYPLRKYVDDSSISIEPKMSKEYFYILKAIINSRYYNPNPEEACILVPSIDTLNQNRLRVKEISQTMGTLPQ